MNKELALQLLSPRPCMKETTERKKKNTLNEFSRV